MVDEAEEVRKEIRAGWHASEDRGYDPKFFQDLVADLGAVGAIKKLLKTTSTPDGLYRLRELGQLENSAEAIGLRHSTLFSPDELAEARRRLDAFGYRGT